MNDRPSGDPLVPVAKGPPPFVHAALEPRALARMAAVLEQWQRAGARYVALPWVAPALFVQASRPAWIKGHDVDTPHGQLLASGEQSLCWLARAGHLQGQGPFIGFTPCFRDEDFDDTHHYGFLKAEVFAWCQPPDKVRPIDQIRDLARQAARLLGQATGHEPVIVDMPDRTVDLELAGLEVGSVGIRPLPGDGPPLHYLYATALAEPRFSQALARL